MLKKEIRKIAVTAGTTYYTTIPKWMIEELGWRKGQKVEIKLQGGKITIERVKK